mmetsp:Transcript_19957/g.40883  ORF Transcript_19957/g.40883 Transcript_19957/m.40883 type:complete len:551 (+) Transcript_19957:214-1866(+)
MPPSIPKDIIPGVHDPAATAAAAVSTATSSVAAATATTTTEPFKTLPRYTLAEISRHSTRQSTWLIYRSQVLDVTKWISSHPGGEQTLLRFAGMDATDEIRAFHDDWVLEEKVRRFVIGTVDYGNDDDAFSELVRDFRELGQTFDQLGYFRVSPFFYVKKLVWVFSIFFTTLFLLFHNKKPYDADTDSNNDSLPIPIALVAATLLGLFWQQFAFIGHDVGHMSTRTHARDHIPVPHLSALVTFFNGISVAWWKATHNVHHAVPNSIDCDPDIAHLPVFALHKGMFGGLFNKYHGRVMEFDWVARRVFVPYQHFWYYPIMMVARFNLYFQSGIFLVNGLMSRKKGGDGHKGRTILDSVAFVGFFLWLGLLLWHIPGSLLEKAVFFFWSHAVAGLLNVQITLSHFPRPIFGAESCTGAMSNKDETDLDTTKVSNGNDNAKVDDVLVNNIKYGGDFYTRNILASLDVSCPRFLDWFHGGLQFQTLHHIYPRIGREHLRTIEPVIASLCKKHGLPYTRMTFWECNLEVVKVLREAASEARKWSPLIYEAMCAHG